MADRFSQRLQPLLPYFRPYRTRMLLGILSIAAAAALGLAAPQVIGRAIDALGEAQTSRPFLIYGALLVLLSLIQGVFNFLQRKILVTVSRDIELDLRDELFARLQRLEPAFYQGTPTGDLMARATNDLEAVRRLCGPAIMYSSNTVFAGAGALFFMFQIHAGLTALSLCTLPLIAVLTRVFGQRIHNLFEAVQEDFSALSTKVQENLSGGRVVRAYTQEEAEMASFEKLSRNYVHSNRQLIRWDSAFRPLLQGVVGLGYVAVLMVGGRLLISGQISAGQFVTFNLFLGKLTWPMIAIGWVINIAQRGLASFGRIRSILEREPTIADPDDPADPDTGLAGHLRLKGLTFTYDSTPVLQDLELEATAGNTIAVVGRTGSGKSTLLSLLPRLIDPPPGSVLLDGIDIRRFTLAFLRAQIAMVPQESFLFSTSIAENIALGKPEAKAEEIAEAARLAGLEDDLAQLAEGLETVVGERGITLSGGQRQRVALARALVRQPTILLLDDCLSAVDAQTEERILRNLATVFPGRTVLMVSHRVSAVQGADLILVLDQGRIVERGSHQQLLARGGLYADLERRQRLEEELAAV